MLDSITLAILSIAVLLLAWQQRRLAREVREQTPLTRDAFEAIVRLGRWFNMTREEREDMQIEELVRLAELRRKKTKTDECPEHGCARVHCDAAQLDHKSPDIRGKKG